MGPFKFAANDRPTLGVEIELNLVDSRTMALRSACHGPLGRGSRRNWRIRSSRSSCSATWRSTRKVCGDVAEVEHDLATKLEIVRADCRTPRSSPVLERHPPVLPLAGPGRDTE